MKKKSIPWNKGKTKEDCPQLGNNGRKKGCITWMKGRHHTEEEKRILSEHNKGQHSSVRTEFKKGEKNPKWKGGVTLEQQRWRFGEKWKKFGQLIRIRDNFTCLRCSQIPAYDGHHMLPVRLGGEIFNENNVVTLCHKCHGFIESKIVA